MLSAVLLVFSCGCLWGAKILVVQNMKKESRDSPFSLPELRCFEMSATLLSGVFQLVTMVPLIMAATVYARDAMLREARLLWQPLALHVISPGQS